MNTDTISRNDSSRTWIPFDSSNTIEVSELYLRNGAHLALAPSSTSSQKHTLNAQSFYGDDDFVENTAKIGTVHVGVNQVITIRQVSLYFPAHAKVYESGTLTLPSTVKWYGTNNLIHGKLGGLQDLTMLKSTLNIQDTGKSHTTPSTFKLSNLYLKQGSKLLMTDATLVAYKLFIGAFCEITTGNLSVEATQFESEEGGVINLDVRGNLNSGDGKYVTLFLRLFYCLFVCLMVFNATFNNISVISWRSVLLVEEIGGPGENHRPVLSH